MIKSLNAGKDGHKLRGRSGRVHTDILSLRGPREYQEQIMKATRNYEVQHQFSFRSNKEKFESNQKVIGQCINREFNKSTVS